MSGNIYLSQSEYVKVPKTKAMNLLPSIVVVISMLILMLTKRSGAVNVNVSALIVGKVNLIEGNNLIIRGHRASEEYIGRTQSNTHLELPQQFELTLIATMDDTVPICNTRYVQPGPQCFASGENYVLKKYYPFTFQSMQCAM